jgi:hypothetical protein
MRRHCHGQQSKLTSPCVAEHFCVAGAVGGVVGNECWAGEGGVAGVINPQRTGGAGSLRFFA